MSDRQVDDYGSNQITEEHGGFTALEKFIVFMCYVITIPLFIIVWPWRSIEQYEKGFFFRFGKSRSGKEPLEPGLRFCLPCDTLMKVDLRQRTYDIPSQNLLTADSVTVEVDGIVFWKVIDPWKALISAEDYHMGTMKIASVSLRNILSSKTLHEILTDRTSIADAVCELADSHCKHWGVVVINVQINDVRLPPELQKSMAAEAEATREAAAKVASAAGELEASKMIAEAALELESGGPNALKVRYLNAIQEIAQSSRNTILFPIPGVITGSGGTSAEDNRLTREVAMMRAATNNPDDMSARGSELSPRQQYQPALVPQMFLR